MQCQLISFDVGLLTHDWSAFRDAEDVGKYLKPMVAATVNG
jgi:hypothetical protein